MKYGFFDDSNKEYVITAPETPVKWINYIGTLKFGGFVDHTGGALICKGDPALNRITKYIPQLPAADFKGESLYVRFKKEGTYQIFSPFYTPTLDKYESYECHVGLQYTRIISVFYGIRTEVTIFVPLNGNQEIRKIKVTNTNPYPLQIDVIPVVEYTHFDALKQFTNADWVPQTMQSRLVTDKQGQKILIQYAFMNKETSINYFTANYPCSSFDSDRRAFLGRNEYGSWARPLSLLEEELNNTQAERGDNIGALLFHLGELAPNESKTIITQLGQTADLGKEESIITYRQEAKVDAALRELQEFWSDYLSAYQTITPEPAWNSMINIHNPRQCYITKNWSRDLSLYQLGFGGRGIGFRDSSQDVMGMLGNKPEEGRELIEKLLHVQKRDGSAMHQFYAKTMEANEGDAREGEDRPRYYSDDHLWIVLAVCAYLKETGNFGFLKQIIPFYEKDKQGKALESAPVSEHLFRAVNFTKRNKGKHGLPLLGFADWNDTINLKTGAESLFTACLYGVALRELIELLTYQGDTETVARYQADYEEIKETFNRHGWDGKWYLRYFDHDGSPLGSNKNKAGKIYINAQSWAVISGFASPERGKEVLQVVHDKMNTDNGIKLSWPGYNGFDPNIGGTTTYPPGAKENGGIFLHTNPWVIIAETILGNGDRAFKYYNQINPAQKNYCIDIYESEPYCYAQNILGDEHPLFGLARNSWLSGTSSWVYQSVTKYVLGVMPTYEGLKVDPCIPSHWNEYQVIRRFRGTVYRIRILNPQGKSKGVVSVTVDGKEQEGNIIPLLPADKTHDIVVTLG